MNHDSPLLSLTIEAFDITLADGISDSNLFSHLKSTAVELLKDDAVAVHHFGLVPDNGADGNDEIINHGTLLRFDASEELLGIDEDAAPNLVKQAFLTVIENNEPVYCTVLHEVCESKKEETIVFHF